MHAYKTNTVHEISMYDNYLFQMIFDKCYAAIVIQIRPAGGVSILRDEDLDVTILFFDPGHLFP